VTGRRLRGGWLTLGLEWRSVLVDPFELGLTQEQVAQAARTSHSAVSRLEKGTHIPQLPTLQRIAAVLDEELLVCFQRTVDGEVEREFAAVA